MAAGNFIKSQQKFDQSGLTGAVFTDQSQIFSIGDGQVDVVENGFVGVIAKRNIPEFDAERFGGIYHFGPNPAGDSGAKADKFEIAREEKVVFVEAGNVGKKTDHHILELANSTGEHGQITDGDVAENSLEGGENGDDVINQRTKNIEEEAIKVLLARQNFVFGNEFVIHVVEFTYQVILQVKNFNFFSRIFIGQKPDYLINGSLKWGTAVGDGKGPIGKFQTEKETGDGENNDDDGSPPGQTNKDY